MKLKNALFAGVLGISATLSAQSAFAGCFSGGCIWYTPIYNQNDIGIGAQWFPNGDTSQSELCAPTSSAMALQGALTLNGPEKTTGWTHSGFAGQTQQKQIADMASLMQTSPTGGTDGRMWDRYRERRNDLLFKLPILNQWFPLLTAHESYGSDVTYASFKSKLAQPTIVVTNYGHYTQSTVTTSLPGVQTKNITYTRGGGHVIAMRGYIDDVMIYNDPWYAQLTFSKLGGVVPFTSTQVVSGVKHVTVQTLPGNSSHLTYIQYKKSGTYFPFLEGEMSLSY